MAPSWDGKWQNSGWGASTNIIESWNYIFENSCQYHYRYYLWEYSSSFQRTRAEWIATKRWEDDCQSGIEFRKPTKETWCKIERNENFKFGKVVMCLRISPDFFFLISKLFLVNNHFYLTNLYFARRINHLPYVKISKHLSGFYSSLSEF